MTQHNRLTSGGPGSFGGMGDHDGEWVESWSARVTLPPRPTHDPVEASSQADPAGQMEAEPMPETVAPLNLEESDIPPPARRRGRAALIVIGALMAVGWAVFVGWMSLSATTPADVVPVMATLAAGVIPILLIITLTVILLSSRRAPSEELLDHYAMLSGRSTEALGLLAAGRESLDSSYRLVEGRSSALATATEKQALALRQACDALEQGSLRVADSLAGSMARVESGAELLKALETATPRLQTRIDEIRSTIARCAMEMAQAGEQAGAMLATHGQAADDLAQAIERMRASSADAGEDLMALAAASSARVDLVLDRARSGLSDVHDRIEASNSAVDALVGRTKNALGDLASDTTASADSAVARLNDAIAAIDGRIRAQAEDHLRVIAALQDSIDSLDQRLVALDSRGGQVARDLEDNLVGLSGQADSVDSALIRGQKSAELLKERSETMLVALDANLREMDESLPAALDRAEQRVRQMQGAMNDALASADPVVKAADAMIERLKASRATTVEQAQTLATHNAETVEALAAQGESIEAMKQTLEDARRLFALLSEESGPRLLETVQAIRASTGSLADEARQSLGSVIEDATAQLGEAGRKALDGSVGDQVTEQLSRLSELADSAVKATHRATDHLLRQMLVLTDSAAEMERRIASADRNEEKQERDFISHRSATIIASLQDNAIDIAKWLDRDIGDKEWTAYLNGDKSLFSRRAVRLLGSGQAHALQTLYRDDPEFAEHVSRYVQRFEELIADVLASREGNTLAIALLSSDVGKLYVGLAQATERLRVG